MGLFTGIFFCIFQVHFRFQHIALLLSHVASPRFSSPLPVLLQLTQVVGNLVAGCIFMFGGSDQDQARYRTLHSLAHCACGCVLILALDSDILFYVFLGVAAGGVLLFLTLGNEVTEKERRLDANERLLERQGGKQPNNVLVDFHLESSWF
jgi:hypothetical protein